MSHWGVLDMGSNTLLFLLAEWQQEIKVLKIKEDRHAIARLGVAVPQSGKIGREACQRAVTIAKFYNNLCRHHVVQKIWGIGTAVFRKAANAYDVIARISQCFTCKFQGTILSPEQEAQLSFWGAELPKRSNQPTIVIDIGGGSTELTVGVRWEVFGSFSLPLGALWLYEVSQQQGWSLEQARDFVREVIAHSLSVLSLPTYEQAYALAGTPVTLAGMLSGIPYWEWWRTHGLVIPRDSLTSLLPQLWTGRERLRLLPTVHPERALILPEGALILDTLMKHLRLEAVSVSIYGLRYGALCELLRREGLLELSEDFAVEDPRLML